MRKPETLNRACRAQYFMSDVKHPVTSWVYLLAPAAIAFFLFHPKVAFVPAMALSDGDPMAPFAAALVGLVPGYILYKRTRVVRSHEWHRIQALNKLSKHYAADDSEAWNRDENVTLHATGGSVKLGELGQAALDKMHGSIGDLMMDDTQIKADIEDEVDVNLLLDQEHVALAAARMRGDVTMEEKIQKSVIRDEDRSSGLDSVLDWVALKIGKRKKADETDSAKYNPTIAVNSESEITSSAAMEYDQMITNSWHCRLCQKMNPIESPYCDQCGTGK